MATLTDKQIAAYFHRCFTAVDGLWFMKAEEKFGFEKALELDNDVWRVFPKIQAREMKAMLHAESGIAALQECFTTGFELKGFDFKAVSGKQGNGFSLLINDCPWHNTMVKSKRTHLSAKIGNTICQTEYSTWASEFGKDIRFAFDKQPRICQGGQQCILHFALK